MDKQGTSRHWLAIGLLAAAAAAQATQPRTFSLGEDRFIGGEQITVQQSVAGDLIVAGRDVHVRSPVSGDLVAAGRRVRLSQTARQDAYIAGSDVTIAGAVERNARLAGSVVTLAVPARIGGNISAAGGEINISGAVSGYVQAVGGRIVINGPIGGDVQLTGAEIRLGPQANIAGALRYRSDDEIEQHPSARVAGGIERLDEAEALDADRALAWLGATWMIGLMILASVLVAVLPAFTRRTSMAATTRFGPTLLIGLAALVIIPLLLLAAAISVVGLPLALALLLTYLLLLLLGFVVAGISLGDSALRRVSPEKREKIGWRALVAAVAVAALALLTWIPVVGFVIGILALLAGVGAIVTQLRRRESAAPVT